MDFKKVVAIFALLAVLMIAVAPAVSIISTDSSADGGEIKGEGESDTMSISYYYKSDTRQWSAIITLKDSVSDDTLNVSIGGEIKSKIPVENSNTLRVIVASPFNAGDLVKVTVSNGSGKLAQCDMYVNYYYIVTVDPNGGKMVSAGWEESGTYYTKEFVEGSKIVLPSLTKSGYKLSWDPNTVNGSFITGDTFVKAVWASNPDPPVVKYTLTASAENGGSITPALTTVSSGSSQTFTITPNMGMKISKVMDGTTDVTSLVSDGKYSLTNITANHMITVTFKSLNSAVITVDNPSGGTISPSGHIDVNIGESKTFTVTPDQGKVVDKVLVNGEEVKVSDGKFTVIVSGDMEIEVIFKDQSNPISISWIIVVVIILIVAIILISYYVTSKKKTA